MITFPTLRQLWSRLSEESLLRVFGDWEVMIGLEATIGATEVHLIDEFASVRELLGTPNVIVSTRVEGICDGPIFYAFPMALALEIIGDVMMIPKASRAEKATSELAEHEVEALQEMANLMCGSSNMAFQHLKHDFRVSQKVEHLKIWNGGTECDGLDEILPDDRTLFVQREIELEDSRHPMLIMLPLELATDVAAKFFPEKAAR